MSDDTSVPSEAEDLKPQKTIKSCPGRIRTFTVCRVSDESGISGTGVVIEGAMFATGHTIIHWLTPAPRGRLLSSILSKISLRFTSSHIHQTTQSLRLRMASRWCLTRGQQKMGKSYRNRIKRINKDVSTYLDKGPQDPGGPYKRKEKGCRQISTS